MFAMQNVFANGMTDGIDISNKEYNPSVEFKKVARQPDTRRGDRLNYLYVNPPPLASLKRGLPCLQTASRQTNRLWSEKGG